MLTYAIRRRGIRGLDLSLTTGWSLGGGKSGSVVSALGAGSVSADSPGADGLGAGAAVAGPALEDSARVDDSGAEVVVAGSSWSCTALAALMISKSLLYKLKRAGYLCDQMQTYSLDFFLTAFFTRKAHHGVSIAGGGV
jgi:hypothetical protein